MIRARGLTVTLGRRHLLDHVDLDVAPGHLVAVLGPNGAGKSTLVDTISGLRRPTGGTVTLGDRPLHDLPRPLLARRLGVLRQHVAAPPWMTAHELVLLGRHPHDDPRTADAVASRCLEQVGLGALSGQRVDTLSGGELRRVHLARVLAQLDGAGRPGAEAQALVLDEPTAGLDLAAVHQVLGLARHLAHERGLAVLAVLHDLDLAARYADHTVLLHRGRRAAAGPTAHVLADGPLSEVYGVVIHRSHHPEDGRLLLTVDPKEAHP